MNNVVLISLPKVETIYPPGARAVLSSVAKENHFDVVIFDYNLQLFNELSSSEWDQFESWNSFAVDAIDQLLEQKLKDIFLKNIQNKINSQTQYVCFSVFSYFSNRIATLVLSWYQQHYQIPSVVGGSGISTDTSATNKQIFGEYLIESKLADFVIFGEGEISFDNLLKGYTDYPGINKNNAVQIDDLSALPTPTYEYVDMSKYHTKKILVTGSRGCVRNCTFCDIELTWPKFKYRRAEHIVNEIKKHFYDYNITEFEFTDSLINGSISNFDRFNELLYEEKQKHPELAPIRYQGQFICRPQTHQSSKSYELMHRAGCSMLITGIESFSNNVRFHMRKKFSNEDIDYHFEQCARWGIPNVLLMIVGYPTETEQDHQDNLNALLRYKKYADMGTIFMIRWGFTMHLYDHTPIMGMLDELGIDTNTNIKFDSLYGWSSTKNPSNTLRERIRRRIEIHELAVSLGYPMPRVYEELMVIKSLSEKVSLLDRLPQQKVFEIKQQIL